MDPVALIITALAAGARPAMQDEAPGTVTGAYGRLRDAVRQRLAVRPDGELALLQYEADPRAGHALLAAELDRAGAGSDPGLAAAALAVLELAGAAGTQAGKHISLISRSQGTQVGDGNWQVNYFVQGHADQPPTAGQPVGMSAGWVSAELVRSAYLAQVQDIAPDDLVGRDGELADWAEFCAGIDPYAWWQAGPWAGKSALASWFVTHPPPGVDVVSFFITGRLYGQADSDAFLDAMIEQLQALDPVGAGSAAVAGARLGMWLNLLTSAAAHAEEQERRLVVVVDGLDEDDAGATPPRGKASIASLLPRRPPPGARFIITSRPDPGLPDDLPIGHPLRSCTPHRLRVSRVAEGLGMRARQELRNLFAGDQTAIDVVGYIAGSGGGLTGGDLSDLSGAPLHKLEPLLRGVFGRSLQTRLRADSRDPAVTLATRVYLFAHETLRVSAEAQLGRDLARYRQKVHEWMDSYARAGWPDTVPGYAIRGYPRLLATTNDTTRLSALARDRRRHAFLLRATESDYAALTEIRTAQALIAEYDVLDLHALVVLAAYRHAISIRNQSIPADLPLAWARLARFDHAEVLARTIIRPGDRVRATIGLVTAAAQAGDLDRARRLAADADVLARTLANPSDRARALTELVTAAARAGDLDRARLLAADAEALARTFTSASARVQAFRELATATAQAGALDHSEALARSTISPEAQVRGLTELVTAAARAGDLDRARLLAVDAEAVARALTAPDAQVRALTELVTAAARAGDLDRARLLAADADAQARTLISPGDRARALTELITAAARAGDLDRARLLAADADAQARTLISPGDRARALTELITAAARAGDLDRARLLAVDAEAVARALTAPDAQVGALTELVTAAAQAGDLDRARLLAADAEALARSIISPGDRARVLTELVTAAAQAGDLDHAEALAHTITSPENRVRTLTELVTAAARAGDRRRARRLATDAEALARTLTTPDAQARALIELATAAHSRRLVADAEALASSIVSSSPSHYYWVLRPATAATRARDPRHDEAPAHIPTNPAARALIELATSAAQAGDLDRAGRFLARALIDDPPGIWWADTVSRLFPMVIRDVWSVLVSAYTAEVDTYVRESPDS